MSEYFKGKTLYRNDESSTDGIDGETALTDKVVALYFSAHWCPPCRAFTPKLKDFYEEASKEGLEIIFLTFDHEEDQFKDYLKESHGPWLYLPFGSDDIKEMAKKYGATGIPALIVIKADGSVAVPAARNDVSSKDPQAAIKEWKEKIAE